MEKQSLNVLLVAPLTAGVVNGGVRNQVKNTARFLKRPDITVDLLNPWELYDPEEYDIVHIFVAGRETSALADRISGENTKLVVSPVLFTRHEPSTVRISRIIEKTGNLFFSGIHSDFSIKSEICKNADLLLPNTGDEAKLISKGFGIKNRKITIVPNGVESRFAQADPQMFRSAYNLENFTLFVGDASAKRKNLLPLLNHVTEDDPPLVVIGFLDSSDYSKQCNKLIDEKENIIHFDNMEHDDPMLESAYAAARVFVLPSLYETPGIAAMEAALAGCTIAITQKGGTREVFLDEAVYIDPSSPKSIKEAVQKAYNRNPSEILKKRLLEGFTWQKVADKTLEAYRSILY